MTRSIIHLDNHSEIQDKAECGPKHSGMLPRKKCIRLEDVSVVRLVTEVRTQPALHVAQRCSFAVGIIIDLVPVYFSQAEIT